MEKGFLLENESWHGISFKAILNLAWDEECVTEVSVTLFSSTVTEESTKDGGLFIFPWKRKAATYFLLEQGKWKCELSGIPLWNISKSFWPVLFKVGTLLWTRRTSTKTKFCFFNLSWLLCLLAWFGSDQGCPQKLLEQCINMPDKVMIQCSTPRAAPHKAKCPFLLIPGLAVFMVPESITWKPTLTYMDSLFFIL